MTQKMPAREFLDACSVDPAVLELRPDYRGLLMVVDGLSPEVTAGDGGQAVEELISAAEKGLPRVNALTDVYNAICVLHQIPFGGEDLEHYQGPARLFRASGTEPFDTASGGEMVIQHPDEGEVVWGDDAGVTCRRWNWRQGRRTALSDRTRSALFILDGLDPVSNDQLHAAADALVEALTALGAEVSTERLLLGAS
ncbi:B3/4 domain-containing protein [Kocuria palustris]|uniref:B3/B4 domain-containing protein n=1 Tax=Kocuria palustris TaxID=71999 RepID=UPI001EF99EE4|nr:phenylalanine--tRNA ligase beta subunit-related protein [Kocuria palustris]MBM7821655.1 DNA/RNA-binding domain of Phe-tRNA-synthetase-like protein [Kocuria palustris]